MKFRNVKTGHILYANNEDCIKMMQSSSNYEEVGDIPVVETPHREEPAPAPKAKTKSTKGKNAPK